MIKDTERERDHLMTEYIGSACLSDTLEREEEQHK